MNWLVFLVSNNGLLSVLIIHSNKHNYINSFPGIKETPKNQKQNCGCNIVARQLACLSRDTNWVQSSALSEQKQKTKGIREDDWGLI